MEMTLIKSLHKRKKLGRREKYKKQDLGDKEKKRERGV